MKSMKLPNITANLINNNTTYFALTYLSNITYFAIIPLNDKKLSNFFQWN